MAVQERKLRPLVVQVGVNIVLLGNRRQLAVVEQPHHLTRPADGRVADRRVVRAGAIDVFVEAIMKQKISVVEKRLVDEYGYDSHSAREALNYVTTLLAQE